MTKQLTKYNYSCLYLCLWMLLLCGCVRRELDTRPDAGEVTIALDWGEQTSFPQQIHYIFYNEQGQLFHEYTGTTNPYTCKLPAGKYRVAIHNTEDTKVVYRGMDKYASAEVYMAQIDIYSGVPLIGQPEEVYGIGRCNEFEEFEVLAGEKKEATATPLLLTKHVKLLFTVTNSANVASIGGVLQGVSPGAFLSSGKFNVNHCAVAFATQSKTDNSFSTKITVFDLKNDQNTSTGQNLVEITVVEKDGVEHKGIFDLTQTIQEIIQNNGGEIPIEIPLEIELVVESAVGLSGSVKPWEQGSGSVDIPNA